MTEKGYTMRQNTESKALLQEARDKCIEVARALGNAASSPVFNPDAVMELANTLESVSSGLFIESAGIAEYLQEVKS